MFHIYKKTFYIEKGPHETYFKTWIACVVFCKCILKRIITVKLPVTLTLSCVKFKSAFICSVEIRFTHLCQLLKNNDVQDIFNQIRMRCYSALYIRPSHPIIKQLSSHSLLLNVLFICFNYYKWRTNLSIRLVSFYDFLEINICFEANATKLHFVKSFDYALIKHTLI